MLRRSTRIIKYGELFWCSCRRNLHTNAARVLHASRDRDSTNPLVPTPVSKLLSSDTDILLDQLKKASTLDRIFELTALHLEVMNAKHIVCCLENISSIVKETNSVPRYLTNNQEFQGLCSQLMRVVRVLDPQDLINAYKSLTALQIRNNTLVMQSLLKMIGATLNSMSLGQLVFLSFILGRQKTNSVVEGLKLALPLVLQVQIEQQLDSDNLTQVVECLQLATKSRLKSATIQKILSSVLDKAKMLSPTNATTTIYALLNLETPMDGYKELLNYSFEVITKNLPDLTIKQIQGILRLCRNQNHYHGRFFFAVADRVVEEKWNLQDTHDVMKSFHKLSFCPANLKDHFASAICEESEAVATVEYFHLIDFSKILVATGHQPEKLQEALRVLLSCEEKVRDLREKAPNLFVRFVSFLAMMGCFPPEHLPSILTENFLLENWSSSKKQGKGLDFERNIFSLKWSLEVYDQLHNFQFPAEILRKLTLSVCERSWEFDSPLEKFLEHGLGGSQFVQSGIFTYDGILIDHVLGMRSGNYPVAIQSPESKSGRNLVFVEDVVLPADAKIVAVVVAHESHYCHDPEVLRGWMDIKVKALAKKKYSPVVINYSNWRNLPDREKIPFLMNEIKLALQEDYHAKSNVLC